MIKEQMHPTHQRPPMGEPQVTHYIPQMPSDETLAARDEEDRRAFHESDTADTMALAADITEPVDAHPPLKVWRCWIGEVDPGDLPQDADGPMRSAIRTAYHELTGRTPNFIFSGWGGVLSEAYRAVHEDREPDITVQLAELRPIYEMLVDEAHREGKCEHPLDRIDWIRRNVGRGEAPEGWQVNDFAALVTVKLGEAIERLNEDAPGVGLAEPDRRVGRECLLAAAMVLLDCWKRYDAAHGH